MDSTQGNRSGKSDAGNRTNGSTDGEEIPQEDLDQLVDSGHPNGGELPKDDVFDLLRNRRRRLLLNYMDAKEEPTATLDELAEYVAAEENDIEIAQLSSSQRKRVYIGLYQCHLPKMDDAGVVEYDQDRGTIELQDISQFDQYLSGGADEESSAASLYATLLVGSLVAVGLLGIGPASTVPAAGWAVVSTLALSAVVLADHLDTGRGLSELEFR